MFTILFYNLTHSQYIVLNVVCDQYVDFQDKQSENIIDIEFRINNQCLEDVNLIIDVTTYLVPDRFFIHL